MSRARFESARRNRWTAFERAVNTVRRATTRTRTRTTGRKRQTRSRKPDQDSEASGEAAANTRARQLGKVEIPRAYRRICQDLALARHRLYPSRTIDRINQLALDGHRTLYAAHRGTLSRFANFVLADFPQEVRRNAKLFWFCSALFFVPFFAMMFAGIYAPEWIYATLDAGTMAQLDATWGEGAPIRSSSENVMAFGHYVNNNIRIDFTVFGGGILFCLGTLFFTILNGIYLGAVFGYIHHAGHEENFYTFVAGHGSFELTAIVIAAMGGMRVGLAVLKPGRFTRRRSLVVHGRVGIRLLMGAAFMTFVAAIIEGFWSANSAPSNVKFVVGSLLWCVVGLWLLLGGRQLAWPFRRGGSLAD